MKFPVVCRIQEQQVSSFRRHRRTHVQKDVVQVFVGISFSSDERVRGRRLELNAVASPVQLIKVLQSHAIDARQTVAGLQKGTTVADLVGRHSCVRARGSFPVFTQTPEHSEDSKRRLRTVSHQAHLLTVSIDFDTTDSPPKAVFDITREVPWRRWRSPATNTVACENVE